jgi:hypothetical protein
MKYGKKKNPRIFVSWSKWIVSWSLLETSTLQDCYLQCGFGRWSLRCHLGDFWKSRLSSPALCISSAVLLIPYVTDVHRKVLKFGICLVGIYTVFGENRHERQTPYPPTYVYSFKTQQCGFVSGVLADVSHWPSGKVRQTNKNPSNWFIALDEFCGVHMISSSWWLICVAFLETCQRAL